MTTANRATTGKREVPAAGAAERPRPLPAWTALWFAIAIPVVSWDAAFVFLRPASMPGQSLAWLFPGYDTYTRVDGRYADLADDFIVAQSILNILESAIGLLFLVLFFRRARAAVLVGFTVSVMTLGKTLLYFTCEAAQGFASLAQASAGETLLYFVIPNGLWILVPGLIVWRAGHELLAALRA